MPGFIYTAGIIAAALWYWAYRFIMHISPETAGAKLSFLAIVFFATQATLSIGTYFVLHRRAPTLSNLRVIYRRGLKWATFFSFGVVFIIGLKLFGLLTVFTGGVFVIFYFLIWKQITQK